MLHTSDAVPTTPSASSCTSGAVGPPLVLAHAHLVDQLLADHYLRSAVRCLGEEEARAVANLALCQAAQERQPGAIEDFSKVATRAIRSAIRAADYLAKSRLDRASGEGHGGRRRPGLGGGRRPPSDEGLVIRGAHSLDVAYWSEDASGPSEPPPSPFDERARRDHRESLRRQDVIARFREVEVEMKKLPRVQQDVLRLKYWEDCGPSQVAVALGLETSAVRHHYREAILSLRRAFGVPQDAHPVPPWRDPPRPCRRTAPPVAPAGTGGEGTP